ncbi:TPA: hypothetical protein ACGO8F_001424 [Streptococcus suis]
MRMDVTIIDRESRRIKSKATCYQWEIDYDYLTNDPSSFIFQHNVDYAPGDFLLGKLQDRQLGLSSIEQDGLPFFLGVIGESENDAINAYNLLNLANFDFVATRKTGSDGIGHLKKLLDTYLIADRTKQASSMGIRAGDVAIPYSYQPSNPPTITNLADYLIHFFKKYRIVWAWDSIDFDSTGQLSLQTKLVQEGRLLQLKNNVYDFVNWNVYYTPANKGSENMLHIIDKTTVDSEHPKILSTWYLTKDGIVSQALNGVTLPTRSKIALYDTADESKPTYLEVAQSELAGSQYSHEIEFDLRLDSKLIQFQDLVIGSQALIAHDNNLYPSVLTGYAIKSSSEFISLKFGHVRSRFKSVFE